MPAHILVIEDNPANLELMTYLLEAHGFGTRTAIDGEAGLEAAAQETPGLIICDLQLPGVSGYEVVQRLKADPILRGVPVVAVTAFAMVDDRQKAIGAGFDGYIPKPIDPEKFVPQVRAFLGSGGHGPPPTAAAARDVAAQGAAAEPPTAPRSPRHTVLVVDDRPVNLDLASSLLEGSGYRVVAAQSMAEGLRLARETPPDLILSDVVMQDGSGYDFLREAKSDPRLRNIPFIFITATMTSEGARQKGLALGASKFLFRPMEPQALLREIESCLGRTGNG